MRRSGGSCAAVTDDEIVEAIGLLARTEGIFAETAGGVTIATLCKLAASGAIRPDERVVALVTGHGLKTVEALAGPGRRPDRHHRPHPGRLRRRRRPRSRPMSVTVRIPTQLRTLTGGAGEVEVEGATVGEALKALDAAHPGFADRLFDDVGRPAPLRQRLPGRRGRPLPRRPGDPRDARPDALHRPRRRRRLSRRPPAGPAPPLRSAPGGGFLLALT